MTATVETRRPSMRSMITWAGVAVIGALAWSVIALARGEEISAVWVLVAGLSSYAIAYRFYARFIVPPCATGR